MATPRRRTTTKDIGLLRQLYADKQLTLEPEFQRKSVWPRVAKAYLVDTIIHDLPIAPLLFRRGLSSQDGRPKYEVIDGQQRLRAVFAYMDNGFRLTETIEKKWAGYRYEDLGSDDQERIRNYDFVVEELTGYTDDQIRDIFKRANKYTVTLSGQELRHAQEAGAFARSVEKIGGWEFWTVNRVLTTTKIARMRNVEFSAELLILLAEGAQDKKSSIDTWYLQYRDKFALEKELVPRLRSYFNWLTKALPNIKNTRWRKPIDLYGLVGALDFRSAQGDRLQDLDPKSTGRRLEAFESELKKVLAIVNNPLAGPRPATDRSAERYVLAVSRQTDNIIPRQTRIDVLSELIS